jgi:hypothetical protein
MRAADQMTKIYPNSIGSPIDFNRKPWLLVSPPVGMASYFWTAGKTIVSVLQHLRKELNKKPVQNQFFIISPEETRANLMEAIQIAKKNQRVLMAFRHLARRWLIKRVRAGNEEDLLTGEVPKQPITLMAWSERRTYTFEPNTILRDMNERILQHSYLFAKFSKPRNPYTNLELTQAQFFSVARQLRSVGASNWIIDALYSCNYDMNLFKQQFKEAVKLQIIRNQFKNLTSADTTDIVLEFIEDQHKENSMHFNSVVYRWALVNTPNSRRIKNWFQKCKEYHTACATISERLELGARLLRIQEFTIRLCTAPTELIEAREAAFKKKLLTERTPEVETPSATPQTEPDSEPDDAIIQHLTEQLSVYFAEIEIIGEVDA